MSAESGTEPHLSLNTNAALAEWDLADASLPPGPEAYLKTGSSDAIELEREMTRVQQLEARCQELQKRYEELYGLFDRTREELGRSREIQQREVEGLLADRSSLEVRVAELSRALEAGVLPEGFFGQDEVLKQIRESEVVLTSKVNAVAAENEELKRTLRSAHHREIALSMQVSDSDSRAREVAEKLLSQSVAVSQARAEVSETIEELKALESPLAGELKQSPLRKTILDRLDRRARALARTAQTLARLDSKI